MSYYIEWIEVIIIVEYFVLISFQVLKRIKIKPTQRRAY